MVEDFHDKGPAYTPGHEEIEIALLRLFEVTGSSTLSRHGAAFPGNARQTITRFASQLFSNLSAWENAHGVDQQNTIVSGLASG